LLPKRASSDPVTLKPPLNRSLMRLGQILAGAAGAATYA